MLLNGFKKTEFSVIVPIYNAEKHLRKCLDSIAFQNYDNCEVILVDDGSVDSSGKICDEYAETYNFFKVIHKENEGVSAARNVGIDEAKGEFIIFVDSDDSVEPAMLKIIHENIKDSKADLYVYNVKRINNNSVERIVRTIENDTVTLHSEKEKFDYFFNTFLQCGIGWEVWGRVFKRSVIKKYNLKFISRNEIFAEDYLFTFQYLLHVNKVSLITNFLYDYLQHEESFTSSLDKREILPKLHVIAEYGYKDICKSKLRYFKRYYYKLYFMMINYHVKYAFKELSADEVESFFEPIKNNRFHKKWMKQVKRNISSLKDYIDEYNWVGKI